MGLSAVCFLNTPIYEKQTLDVIRAAMPHRNVRPKGALSPTTAGLMLFKLVSVHPRPRTNHCRRSSQVSVPETPPKSSKCHQTTPPDRLVTQNPAQLGHAPHQAHRGSPSLPGFAANVIAAHKQFSLVPGTPPMIIALHPTRAPAGTPAD